MDKIKRIQRTFKIQILKYLPLLGQHKISVMPLNLKFHMGQEGHVPQYLDRISQNVPRCLRSRAIPVIVINIV